MLDNDNTGSEDNKASGRPHTVDVSSGGNQPSDIEDTRFSINEVEQSFKRNSRILAQLIKSNDSRAVDLVPFFKERVDLMILVDEILEEHLKKMGGR